MLFSVLYFVMYLFCMAIVGIVYACIVLGGDKQLLKSWFRRALMVQFVYMAGAMLRGYVNLTGGCPARMLLMIEIVYSVLLASVVFAWAYYLWLLLRPDITKTRASRFFSHVPWGLFCMLLITSPWTRAFFYIDRGRVMEGQLYGLQIPLLLTAQLTVLASAFALLRYAESANNRHKAVLAAVYPAFSLGMKWLAEVTGYTYLPTVAVIMTIGALHIYLWDLSQLVAVDPLTHINNRNRLYNYIETKREQKNCRLYLLMIDVNHFKSINDNYGHVEGDEALIRVSNALRHACRILAKSPFISRYGGDEFVIAAELAGDQELEELIANIHRNLNYFNEWAGVGYELTVSVGAVKVGSEPGDIRELIRMADRKLYEQKKRRKQGECDGRQNVHAENGIS